MEQPQIYRLSQLRAKFDKEGPSSLTQAEGEDFVKLMRLEAATFSRAKSSKRATGTKKEPKSAPAPTASAFAEKLAAMRAKK